MDMRQDDHHRRSEHNSETSQPNAKRQKIKLACEECRLRKVRCDGQRPVCRSCSRKKQECVYSAAAVDTNEGYINRLERRIRELEAQSERPNSLPKQSSHVARENVFSSTASDCVRPISQQPVRRILSRSGPQLGVHGSGSLAESNHSNHSPSGISTPVAQGNTPRSLRRMVPTSHVASPAEDVCSNPRQARQHMDSIDQHENRLRRAEITNASPHDEISVEHSPAFLGSSSAVGFASEVYQTFKSGNGDSTNIQGQGNLSSHDNDTGSSALWFGHATGPLEEYQAHSVMADFVVPPRKIADELVYNYWESAHPLQPCIFKGNFMKRYHELWQSDTTDPGERHGSGLGKTLHISALIFHCILNLVFALGCRFKSMSSGSKQRLGSDRTHEQFAQRATRLLSLDLMDYGSIQLVQALLLKSQYLQTLSMSNKCWVTVGMAIRVAQAIGLHLDISGETQAQREERRRAWHSCELLDSVLSMTFGRPLMLQLKSSTPLPEVVDEEFLTTTADADNGTQPPEIPAKCAFFVSIIKLSHITAEILRLFYFSAPSSSARVQPPEDCASLLRLDASLEHWKEELPSYLQYENLPLESPDVNSIITRQAHLLHHRFLYGKVLLFRRVVVRFAAAAVLQRPAPSGSEIQQMVTFACIDKCVAAAQGLLDLIRSNLGTWFLPPTWYTVFVIYTAGTVFTVVLLSPALRQRLAPEQKQQLQLSWDQCAECLGEYQALGDVSASKCLSNLQRIYSREGFEPRTAPTNPIPQHDTAHGPVQNATDATSADSHPFLPNTDADGQNIDWDLDEWALNWTNDCIAWPGDFATFPHSDAWGL